ncbi:MAG: hypothetical protein WAV38_37660, partial [Xanthobacteraceae bacterium]
ILAGAGGFEPPNGGIKICPTTLIEHGFSPDRREKRPWRIKKLHPISRLPNWCKLERSKQSSPRHQLGSRLCARVFSMAVLTNGRISRH